MKKIIAIIICVVLVMGLCGCRQADKVSYNVSKEADAFNVVRRLTVLNTRTDTVMRSRRRRKHDKILLRHLQDGARILQ